MKIVLIYLGRKGAGPVYSYEYTKGLLAEGVKVCAIISSYSENITYWESLSDIYNNECFKLYKIKTYNSLFSFIINSFNFLRYFRIIQVIKKFSGDFIISTMIHPWHNIIFFFLKKYSIKRIKIIHDVKPHKGENSLIHRLSNYIDIYNSDLWIVLTQNAKNELMQYNINPNKICIIRHANFSYYIQDASYNSPNTIFNKIAFIGRINKYKGLDVLLKAFELVIKERPELKLLIAGNGDCNEYLEKFKQLGSSLELDIRWIEDKEMQLIFNKIDYVVLPYIEATQSGIIPLSFAFRKPVIATKVGGLPEQVPEGTGILIPPNDYISLSNTILSLYDNPQEIRTMGEKAFYYANNELKWDESIKLLINFCNENING